jgi:hypothetical protein
LRDRVIRQRESTSSRPEGPALVARAPGTRGGGARLLGAVVVLTVALSAVFFSTAAAVETHPYTGVSFGPDGVGASQSFTSLRSVAVDPGSGDVYAYDSGAGAVFKFNAAGEPVNFSSTGSNEIAGVGGYAGGTEFQVAVAPAGSPGGTAGDIYVANNGGAIQIYGSNGAKIEPTLSAGGETCGVATDPAGSLYAGVYPEKIKKYVPSANPPTETDLVGSGTIPQSICNIAVDGSGNYYGATYSGAGLYKLEGLADSSAAQVDPLASSAAVDPTSNDVYADRGGEVVQYSSAGTKIVSFGAGEISGSHGLGVASGASKVYVATPTEVKVFGPLVNVEPPAVTMGAVSEVKFTTAEVTGEVNPEGFSTSCGFEYVTKAEFEVGSFAGAQSSPCTTGPGSGSAPVAVQSDLTGLKPGTEYHVRLTARNSGGTAVSPEPSPTFTTVVVAAPTVTTEAPSAVGTGSAHLSGHINPNAPAGNPPAYDVSWHFQCTPECPGVEGNIAADAQSHLVEGTATGLLPGTTYQAMLVAENAAGPVSSQPAESFTTDTVAPTVGGESASEVVRGGATLNAQINPGGAETTYHFDYLPKAAFESDGGFASSQTQSTPESQPLGGAPGNVHVFVRIEGLPAHVAYMFRAVATNAVDTGVGTGAEFTSQLGSPPLETDCPNQSLRTGVGARLPDCRAYEQVSPANKRGNGVDVLANYAQAAPDGSAMTYYSTSGTGIPAGGGAHQDVLNYLASRGEDGWGSQRLLPPEALGTDGALRGLTADTRYAVMEAFNGPEGGLYLYDTTNEAVTTIVPPRPSESNTDYYLAGSSADDSLIYFESRLKLTDNALEGVSNFYVWNRESNEISLAGVLPGAAEAPPANGAFAGAYNWMNENPNQGGTRGGLYVGALHAISTDGDRAYFTSREQGQLYLRKGLRGSSPATVQISVPNEDEDVVDPVAGERPAAFQEATPDGSRAFFLSSKVLTEDANTGPSDEGQDLYRYDATAEHLVDVTPDPFDSGARVLGLLGASQDGKTGFFAARAVLAAGGVDGERNVYHFAEQSDGSFQYQFVTKLGGGFFEASNWTASDELFEEKSSRVSADGETVIFESQESLAGNPAGGCSEGVCNQIFRWSTADGLGCISCNPTGERPLVGSELFRAVFEGPLLPNHPGPQGVIPRNLSADGNRVFFHSSSPLLPEDISGGQEPEVTCRTALTCRDVYEWEAVGTGSCKIATWSGGCIYLISGGENSQASMFIGASANGSDAFFITAASLVPSDGDEQFDVYDARINGGLSAQHQTSPPPCESGQACKGPGPVGATPATPGTATFQGPGNEKPKPTKCKKGKKRKNGKCVSKKHKKHKKGKNRGRTASKKMGGAK